MKRKILIRATITIAFLYNGTIQFSCAHAMMRDYIFVEVYVVSLNNSITSLWYKMH